jgi:hypothetical protein
MSVLPTLSFPQLDLFAGSFWWEEKTARTACEHQYGELRAIANRAGNRAGDRGQDFADSQNVRCVQERGRFAGDSWARSKAPRKNAQVFDGRETGRREIRSASIGEVPSTNRKATIRALIITVGAWVWAGRGAKGLGRRCGCRSLPGLLLSWDGWSGHGCP